MHPNRIAAAAAIAILLGCASPLALAQASPYYIGVSQSFAHDSNLLRLSDGQATPAGLSKSDTVSSTALVAGVDQTLGRQRLTGSAALRANRYDNNSRFDSEGYSLAGGLQWQTIERLSGTVSVGADRTLRTDVRDRNEGLILRRNTETSRSFGATAALGVAGPWGVEIGGNWRDVDYSAEEAEFREYEASGASLGVRWRPGGSTTLGLGVSRSRVDYPQLLVGFPDPSDRRTTDNVDLSADWAPSGISTFNARISRGKTSHAQFAERDFSATSGSLAWGWQPGGRLRFTSRLARDVGQEANRATTAFSRTTDSLRVQADYGVSAKVNVYASVQAIHRRLTGNGVFVSGVSGSDNSQAWSVGARWAPLRSVSVGCDYIGDRRGKNSSPILSDPYRAQQFSCFGQFTLQ